MAKPVTHFSRIRKIGDCTITGTLCNRMTADEINCSQFRTDVTCKFCLRALHEQETASEIRPATGSKTKSEPAS